MSLLSRLKKIGTTLPWRWTMHPSQLRITHVFQNTTAQAISILLSAPSAASAPLSSPKGLAIALASDLPDIVPTTDTVGVASSAQSRVFIDQTMRFGTGGSHSLPHLTLIQIMIDLSVTCHSWFHL
jgi:hypothetical protein